MADTQSIKRYGASKSGAGGQQLPFARAVEADGWLYVSGQVPMKDGEIVHGSIVDEAHLTIQNVIGILDEAGYGLEHIVRVGVWLDDPRDFWSFNGVYRSYFSEHPPARACVQARMMVDCRIEMDCVAFNPAKK
ncbi:MAG: Rid family hydrolase [Pseudomonadota bacterium]